MKNFEYAVRMYFDAFSCIAILARGTKLTGIFLKVVHV